MQPAGGHGRTIWFALLAVALFSVNLRTVFSSLPPLLADVRADLGLSASVAGLLTTGPVLCFGVLAPLAPSLARRWPVERLLIGCAALTATGAGLRGLGSTAWLYAATIAAGAAVAIGQSLLPVLIRSRFHTRVGLFTGAFSTSLTVGAAFAAGTAVPLERLLGGWTGSLAFWALPGALGLLLLLPLARGETRIAPRTGPPLRHDPVAWSVSLYFGVQSTAFYAGLTWLPSILQADGYSKGAAGSLQALGNALQFAPAFAIPLLAHRRLHQRGILTALVATALAGLVGLLVAPAAAPLWFVLIGLGQGAALGLALILPVLRGGDAQTVASLTAMALSVGYLTAALGPFGVGLARDASGGWTVPLLCLIAITAAELPAGLPAAGARRLRA